MNRSKTEFLLKPLKWYKELNNHKERLTSGVFLIEGEKAVNQIINTHPREIVEILVTEDYLFRFKDFPLRILSEKQIHSISSTKTPQGIIAIVRLPADSYSDVLPSEIGSKLLLLEDIQDPGNVGTLIRTAVAFNFSGVILSEKCADPYSLKCVQASAGSILSVWIRRTKNYIKLVNSLKDRGYILIATTLDGDKDISIISKPVKSILALGNESTGLSEGLLNLASYRLRIPIDEKKVQSLNVAIAGAICMYLSHNKVYRVHQSDTR